jgi:hypothetical protein
MSKQVKTLSTTEHINLWHKVESEGFAYYMLDYGPDLKAIEKLGFNIKEVKDAINLFAKIESKIDEALVLMDEQEIYLEESE